MASKEGGYGRYKKVWNKSGRWSELGVQSAVLVRWFGFWFRHLHLSLVTRRRRLGKEGQGDSTVGFEFVRLLLLCINICGINWSVKIHIFVCNTLWSDLSYTWVCACEDEVPLPTSQSTNALPSPHFLCLGAAKNRPFAMQHACSDCSTIPLLWKVKRSTERRTKRPRPTLRSDWPLWLRLLSSKM